MNRLKQLRKEGSLTLQEVSKIFSISPESFRKYETGEREPSQELLIEFANHFNVSLDYMLGRSDQRYLTYNSDPRLTKLSESENELLKIFNSLDLVNKNRVIGYAYALAR